MKMFTPKVQGTRGFTLVELLVSVGIFILMTTLMIAKYGNFNDSVLLTNLAYDVAITLRTAQTYGLSVKTVEETGTDFKNGYGVYFSTATNDRTKLVFFEDDNDKIYDGGDYLVETYNIKRGAYISDICVGTESDDCTNDPSQLHVSFKRPDPDAHICFDVSGGFNCVDATYAEITVTGADGGTRKVTVRQNGQISVLE